MFLKVFQNLRSKYFIIKETFEHVSTIVTEPWALTNEIVLNTVQYFIKIFSNMQNFLENKFLADRSVRFNFHFDLHNCSAGFFSMYRALLKLKNRSSFLCKNGIFANKTLFTNKTKNHFCNFANKQINKTS